MERVATAALTWLLGEDSLGQVAQVEEEAAEHKRLEAQRMSHHRRHRPPLTMRRDRLRTGLSKAKATLGERSCRQQQGDAAFADSGGGNDDIRRSVARFLAGDDSDSSPEASDVGGGSDGSLDLGHAAAAELASTTHRQPLAGQEEAATALDSPTARSSSDLLRTLSGDHVIMGRRGGGGHAPSRQQERRHSFTIGRQAGTPQDLLEYMWRKGHTTVVLVNVPSFLSTLHDDSLTELLGKLGFQNLYDFALCVPVLIGSEEVDCAYVNLVTQEALRDFVQVWWSVEGVLVYAAPTPVRSLSS
eukprot:TRINITY_DN12090_c0_g2_i1.p1 TRINITY_DN12090_c0_g2~~TRINITY_DN12090_c0_g2_i1.p1  ORF type:complete len:302 (+),score=59.29 TRINITY_DN12090_c0_g2_i1:202-1107(+)